MNNILKRAGAIVTALMLIMCTCTVFADSEEKTEGEKAADAIVQMANFLGVYNAYEYIDASALYEAALRKLIEENPELYTDALSAMLESIDQNSVYFTPEEAQQFLGGLSGETVGIGVTLSIRGGELTVGSVFDGSPAKAAGILPDDVIISADGTELSGMDLDMATGYIKGEVDSQVVIGVKREGAEDILYFTITRAVIEDNPVSYKVLGKGEDKAFYIRLKTFSKGSSEKFRAALDEADKLGISDIVIDLRNNGGGYLSEGVAIANYFVPKGKIITVEDHKINMLDKSYTANFAEESKYNAAVLINGGTASASEILTEAIRENGVGVAIGEKSYGKGTTQSVVNFKDGGMMKYTSAFYLTPNGNNINGVGIEPDAVVENLYVPVDMNEYGKFSYTRVFGIGDLNEEVLIAKKMLATLGFYNSDETEVYTEKLMSAVEAFQKSAGLFPYGILDITTQNEIYKTLESAKVLVDEQLNAALSYFGIEN